MLHALFLVHGCFFAHTFNGTNHGSFCVANNSFNIVLVNQVALLMKINSSKIIITTTPSDFVLHVVHAEHRHNKTFLLSPFAFPSSRLDLR